jgi:dTDP-4-dehydrorhamnose reductase/acyl carrier protein
VVVSALLADQTTEAAEEQLLKRFREMAVSAGLKSYEIPGQCVVEREAWTVDRGLLTTIGKINRAAVRAHYQLAKTILPVRSLTSLPLAEGLKAVLLECVPALAETAHLDLEASLASLGADSMALARVANRLNEVFGTSLTLSQVIAAESLRQLQALVFGGETSTTKEINWNAELAESVALLRPVPKPASSSDSGAGVLLTGATGFFGPFLAAELGLAFERVTVLVRGETQSQAEARFGKAYKGALRPEREFRVIAGDVGQPQFGLSDAEYRELVQSCGLVVHNAATVNSTKRYGELKPGNVLGTVNVLNFCLAAGARLAHISSVGLMSGSGVRAELPVGPDAVSRLSGYAQSKWVAESLVLHAHAAGLLQATVYRVATLFASAEGVFNPADSVVAILLGLAETGLISTAPDSPLPSPLNLVPVDWAAHAIRKLTLLPETNR